MPNKKTITFTIVYERVYNLVFEGVSIVDTIVISIATAISHSFVSSALANFINSISLSTSLTMPTSALSNFTNTVYKSISQSYIMSQIQKFVLTYLLDTDIAILVSEISKTIASISLAIGLDMTPILAVFSSLSDYDADALSTMDTETLGDLDYTLV